MVARWGGASGGFALQPASVALPGFGLPTPGPTSPGRQRRALQCHYGLDTLAGARRGARGTGADFSERAVGQARLPEPDDARLPLLYSLKATKAA